MEPIGKILDKQKIQSDNATNDPFIFEKLPIFEDVVKVLVIPILLAFAFYYWEHTQSAHIIVELILAIIIYLLFLVFISLKKHIKQIELEYEERIKSFDICNLNLCELALNLALNPKIDPFLEDNDIRYTLFRHDFYIKNNGDYYAEIEKHGINQSSEVVKFIKVGAGGDSSVDYNDIKFEAFDLKTGNKLVDKLVDEKYMFKSIQIWFKKPIIPNESFSIKYHYFWKGAYKPNSDYAAIMIKYFKRGIEKVIFNITMEEEPKVIFMQEITKDGQVKDCKDQPVYKISERGVEYNWSTQNPNSLCYIFKYVK